MSQGAEKARRRAALLPDGELLDWFESAAAGVARHAGDYRRTRDPAHLGEIRIALGAMSAVREELAARDGKRDASRTA